MNRLSDTQKNALEIAVNTVTDSTFLGALGQFAMLLLVSPPAAAVVGVRGLAGLALRFVAERDFRFENHRMVEEILADKRNPLALNGAWTLGAAGVAALSMDWTQSGTFIAMGMLVCMGLGNTVAGIGQRLYHAFNQSAQTPKALEPDMYWAAGRGFATGPAFLVAAPFLGRAVYNYYRHHGEKTSFWRSPQALIALASVTASTLLVAMGEYGAAACNLFLGLSTLSNAMGTYAGGVAQFLGLSARQQPALQPT